MDKILYTLKIIYINRFRQLTYNDSSKFWIPFILYFVIIFKILNGSFPSFPAFDYKEYLVLFFSFMASQQVNIRKDFGLLKGLFNPRKTYLIYLIDLILVNVFNIIVAIHFGWMISLAVIFALILFFTFYNGKIGKPMVKNRLRILDVLTIVQLRRFKINYLIFIGAYYISYQGLIENNLNLFLVSIVGILFLLLGNIQKTEKLAYFISSKLSNKQYILKNEIDFSLNSLLFILPCLIMALFLNPTYFGYGISCLGAIIITFPIKYIFINHQFPIGLLSMLIVCFFLTIILNEKVDWLLYLSIFPISFILHLIAFRKFTKERITGDSGFYL